LIDIDPETCCVSSNRVRAPLTRAGSASSRPRTSAAWATAAPSRPARTSSRNGQKAYYRTPLRAHTGGPGLPATTEVARTQLAIPISPVLTAEQAAGIVPTERQAGSPLRLAGAR